VGRPLGATHAGPRRRVMWDDRARRRQGDAPRRPYYNGGPSKPNGRRVCRDVAAPTSPFILSAPSSGAERSPSVRRVKGHKWIHSPPRSRARQFRSPSPWLGRGRAEIVGATHRVARTMADPRKPNGRRVCRGVAAPTSPLILSAPSSGAERSPLVRWIKGHKWIHFPPQSSARQFSSPSPWLGRGRGEKVREWVDL
jgi:hypothetical protein